MVDATDSTLGTSEMIHFHYSSLWRVGRAYCCCLAHIYHGQGECHSLCGRFVRSRWDDLYSYIAGQATCKGCLRKFRAARQQGGEEEG